MNLILFNNIVNTLKHMTQSKTTVWTVTHLGLFPHKEAADNLDDNRS